MCILVEVLFSSQGLAPNLPQNELHVPAIAVPSCKMLGLVNNRLTVHGRTHVSRITPTTQLNNLLGVSNWGASIGTQARGRGVRLRNEARQDRMIDRKHTSALCSVQRTGQRSRVLIITHYTTSTRTLARMAQGQGGYGVGDVYGQTRRIHDPVALVWALITAFGGHGPDGQPVTLSMGRVCLPSHPSSRRLGCFALAQAKTDDDA